MEQRERGYVAPPDRFVCPSCVNDPFLTEALMAALEEVRCSYCGAPEAADISVLLDEIGDAILADHTDPANELPYESREGGYQGRVLDGSEVLEELDPWTVYDELYEDVAEAFAGSSWCERDHFALNQHDALFYGWAGFSEQIKHRTRYLFLQELGDDRWDGPNDIPPGRMLDALGTLFQEFELFTSYEAGTEFVRARIVPKGATLVGPGELGTAPRAVALYPNRMSPAGIPMFYAAFDDATAVLETWDSRHDSDRDIVLARFRAVRDMQLLDLTSMPPIPSTFDREDHTRRQPLRFLDSFERDFTRPVDRDEKAHIDYVPTQAVTEFVRHRVRTNDGSRVDGIVYRSSWNRAAKAVVVFAEAEHCGPRPNRRPLDPEPFLDLVSARTADATEFKRLGRRPEENDC